MDTNEINIGLFGFGAVGEGLHHVINNARNTNAKIKSICIKDKNKHRSIRGH